MFKNFGCISLIVFLFAIGLNADVVQEKERFITIKYSDGYVEKYKVKWLALRDINTREEGTAAKPFEWKFIDDRRCFWDINARIERRLYFLTRSGQEFAKDLAFKSYNSDFQNKGNVFSLANFRSENCNDARPRRDSDWNDAKTKLLNAFNEITAQDFGIVVADLKKNNQVVSIVEQ